MKNIIVIDQGGHSTRALLFDAEGTVLSTATTALNTHIIAKDYIEQNPQEVFQSISNSLNLLAKKLSVDVILNIDSVALIVQRSSFLACRKSDCTPLSEIISWQDTRHQKWLEQLKPSFPMIQTQTGLRPNAHYGASKMRWLLENNEEIKTAANIHDLIFVPLAAYLVQQLVMAKEFVVDPVIASRTLLCSLGEMHWNDSLCELFGIDKNTLPKIVASDYLAGDIEFGNKRIPLQLVGGDQSFIPFSLGVNIQAEDAFVNIGTGAFIQTLVDNTEEKKSTLYSPIVITTAQKTIVAEGTVNAASSALDWLWLSEEESLTHEDINFALATIHNPILFINTVAGTGSPYWLPATTPKFIGNGMLLEKAVAVLESVVFALMDNYLLLRIQNPHIQHIIVSGGLAQYDGFCQKLANLTQVSVLRPKDVEASSRGAAYFLLKKTVSRETLPQDLFVPKTDALLAHRYKEMQIHLINLSTAQ